MKTNLTRRSRLKMAKQVGPPVHSDSKLSANPDFQKIMKLVAKKKYSQARRLAEDVGVKTKNLDLLLMIGSLFKQMNKNTSAKHLYQKALKLAPDDPKPHFIYGRFLHETGDLAGAEKELRKAIEVDEDFAAAYTVLGNVLAARNRLDEAEDAFNTGLDLDDTNAYSWTCLGALHAKRKEFKEAEKMFKKAIKIDKKFPLSYFNLMILYKQQNREKDEKKLRKQATKNKIMLPEIKIIEKGSQRKDERH
jgi:tetratricopeptide (TPR) repeat protein